MTDDYKIDSKYEDEYLNSFEWAELRNKRLKLDNYTCQGCGCCGTQSNPLVVHHLDYKGTNGNYRTTDYKTKLVTLCWNCHNLIHRIMARVVDDEGTKGWLHKLPPSNHIYLVNESIQSNRPIQEVRQDRMKALNEDTFIKAQQRILHNG